MDPELQPQPLSIIKESDYEFVFKVVLVGDASVGKSNLLMRFTKNEFSEHSRETIGVHFTSTIVKIGTKNVKAQIWDTAGQERYRSITHAYYRGAVGAIIVYDMTAVSSFASVQTWLKDLRDTCSPSVVILLVGNKSDLKDEKAVPTEDARLFAEKHQLLFMETSALDTTNVDEAFSKLLSQIYNSMTKTASDMRPFTHSLSAVDIEADALPGISSDPTSRRRTCCQK
ncbi:hypothetical protein EMCRGX_G025330 [Ephydatia muelleri]